MPSNRIKELSKNCYTEITALPLYMFEERQSIITDYIATAASDSMLADLIKLRKDVMCEQAQASSPPPYLSESDYSSYMGKEIAYDDVLDRLNKIIEEHT